MKSKKLIPIQMRLTKKQHEFLKKYAKKDDYVSVQEALRLIVSDMMRREMKK